MFDSWIDRMGCGLLLMYIASIVAWATAVLHDLKNDLPWWVLLDILFGPIGMIRGVMIWLDLL